MMPDSLEPRDLRFGYEVIANLAESVRQMTAAMGEMQKTQVDVLVRLARIEANKVNEEVARLETRFSVLWNDVDRLKQIEDRRDGANRFAAAILKWWPVIGVGFTVFFLIFRAIGIIHLPTEPITIPAATRPSVQIEPDRREGP